jgi:hypothetical protein
LAESAAKFLIKLPLAVTALTFRFTLALAIQGHAAMPAAATISGLMLAQAMVPPTGMMDAEHPMPTNERYLRRFPQPVRVGDLWPTVVGSPRYYEPSSYRSAQPIANSLQRIPSNASPYPTPCSIMRQSFWFSAMRVYRLASSGSCASPPAIVARGSSLSAGTISLTEPYSFAVSVSSSCWASMKIASTYAADHLQPDEIDAITEYDAKVRLILKNRRRSGEHNISEQNVFGMLPHRDHSENVDVQP